MLKTYMIFSRICGPAEGAALVFAHTAREARKIGWRGIGSDLTDEYIDLGVERIWRSRYLFAEANQTKLANDEPHVISNPHCCKHCEKWGQSAIGDDGLCEECRDIQIVLA